MQEEQLIKLITSVLSSDSLELLESASNFFDALGFSACHDNFDVAQDALDAAKHGKLSPEQAKRIVEICLENSTRKVKQQPLELFPIHSNKP